MNKKQIKYDKPIAVGFSVLELSKVKMYDFHYNVMKKIYPENGQLQLLFTAYAIKFKLKIYTKI